MSMKENVVVVMMTMIIIMILKLGLVMMERRIEHTRLLYLTQHNIEKLL